MDFTRAVPPLGGGNYDDTERVFRSFAPHHSFRHDHSPKPDSGALGSGTDVRVVRSNGRDMADILREVVGDTASDGGSSSGSHSGTRRHHQQQRSNEHPTKRQAQQEREVQLYHQHGHANASLGSADDAMTPWGLPQKYTTWIAHVSISLLVVLVVAALLMWWLRPPPRLLVTTADAAGSDAAVRAALIAAAGGTANSDSTWDEFDRSVTLTKAMTGTARSVTLVSSAVSGPTLVVLPAAAALPAGTTMRVLLGSTDSNDTPRIGFSEDSTDFSTGTFNALYAHTFANGGYAGDLEFVVVNVGGVLAWVPCGGLLVHQFDD
jgi:hypothetical protein